MEAGGTKRGPAIHHDGTTDGTRFQIRLDPTNMRADQGPTTRTGTGTGTGLGIPQGDTGCEELGLTR
jgi:hypothetical protein